MIVEIERVGASCPQLLNSPCRGEAMPPQMIDVCIIVCAVIHGAFRSLCDMIYGSGPRATLSSRPVKVAHLLVLPPNQKNAEWYIPTLGACRVTIKALYNAETRYSSPKAA